MEFKVALTEETGECKYCDADDQKAYKDRACTAPVSEPDVESDPEYEEEYPYDDESGFLANFLSVSLVTFCTLLKL